MLQSSRHIIVDLSLWRFKCVKINAFYFCLFIDAYLRMIGFIHDISLHYLKELKRLSGLTSSVDLFLIVKRRRCEFFSLQICLFSSHYHRKL